MNFIEQFNLKAPGALKIAGFAIVAIVLIAFTLRMVGSSFNTVFNKGGSSAISSKGMPVYDYADNYEGAAKYGSDVAGLSVRNVSSIMPPTQNIVTGDTSEQFEVTEYNASIETRQLKDTCATVANLKAQEYVIFENAGENDRACNYVFKVKKDKVEEILAVVKGLKPKELSDNTYTIKGLVDDYTSEVDILTKKLASIEETLKKATNAYDDITALAINVKDVESLARIIDSKINIIERLTQERINVNSQLDRIGRSKAEQLDRLEYTYFRINITENKFIDIKNLKDSWKAAIKLFVRDVNQIAQDITINLVSLLLAIFQYVIYFLIILFVIKYGWQLVKYIWNK